MVQVCPNSDAKRTVESSQAVAPCAPPVLDIAVSAEPTDTSDQTAKPGDSCHSGKLAAADNLPASTTSNPPDMNHTSRMLIPPSLQHEQVKISQGRRGRPASAAHFRTLRQLSRTLPGALSKTMSASSAVSSPKTQRNSLVSQDPPLQPPSAAVVSIHTRERQLPLSMQHQAFQSQSMPAQPLVGTASMTRATLRRPSKLLLPGQGLPEDGSLSAATSRRSPKPTLLRDQHMPGELLHQKTAFPSDVFMRHEAACASPTSSPHLDAVAGNQPASFSSSLHRTLSQTDTQGAWSAGTTMRHDLPGRTLLHDQPLSAVLLRQHTASPSDTTLQQEAARLLGPATQPGRAISAASNESAKQHSGTAREPQQQQQSHGATQSRGAAVGAEAAKSSNLPRTVCFAAAFLSTDTQGSTQADRASDKRMQPTSGENSLAASDLASIKSPTPRALENDGEGALLPLSSASDAAVPEMALSQSRDRDSMQASDCTQTEGSRGSGHRPKPSLKRADSRLKQSSQDTARSPRSLAGPWFEATTCDLTRNKTWAREWLEMGVQDADPTVPEFAQLQQQSLQHHSLQQLSLQQQSLQQQESTLQPDQANTQQQQPQISEQQLTALKTLQQHSQQQPADHTGHETLQTPLATARGLSSPNATARSHQDHIEPDAQAMQHDKSLQERSQQQGRPQSAPEGFLATAAAAPWAMDVRRLHSARPGSGGSPTARCATGMTHTPPTAIVHTEPDTAVSVSLL